MKRTRALLTTALPVALVAALALTSCSSEDNGDAALSQDCLAPGDASSSIKIEGEFGGEVTLTSETPIEVTEIERSVLIEGDGDALEPGASAVANFTLFDGKTGEVIAPGASTTVVNTPEELAPWAGSTIACSALGDRVVSVMPASDLFGAGGGESYNLVDSDAVVAVLDFTDVVLSRAEGNAVDAPAGFPSVELGEGGAPTITIPEGEPAPTELGIATVIEGDGAEVQETDAVTVHYTGVVWSSGKTFDSSWDRGQASTFAVTGVVPGFSKALIGQKVGSQVIAVIPADEGYGDDTASRLSAAEAIDGDVMVFVIDILATAPAAG